MSHSEIYTSSNYNGSCDKVLEIETTLLKTIIYYKELYAECKDLRNELLDYRTQYTSLKEKCEGKCCSSAEILQREIDNKNNILQQIATSLSVLLETKNFNIISDIFKIICGGGTSDPIETNVYIRPKKEKISQDDSLSEIEGTPTGRTSPIIQSKKMRNTATSLSLNNKRKCPASWVTPEKSSIKLNFPSPSTSKPGGRMKQSKLNLIKMKTSSVVDLTCSSEVAGQLYNDFENNIKREIPDIDETIMPSPTSRAINLPEIQKSNQGSPCKFKHPTTPLKFKIEEDTRCGSEHALSATYTQHSIDLMEHCRKGSHTQIKSDKQNEENKEANESMSLLQQNRKSPFSPSKNPLLENKNVINTEQEIESSASMLRRDCDRVSPVEDQPKRIKITAPEPVYKEPVVRKRCEKRALRGWSCDRCRNFYGELYKDDPEMLAIKMDECSKHRGKNNPIRPKTPPGFWNPRWDVPTDTEEFNRRNNAV